MTLGFSVEHLVSAGRGGGALRMGLVRVAEDQWLQRDTDIDARKAGFAAHPDAIRILPEAGSGGA